MTNSTTWSKPAEEAILGALVVDPASWDEVQEWGVAADDFYAERHRVTWRLAEKAIANGDPFDPDGIWQLALAEGVAQQLGGDHTWLWTLATKVYTVANIGYHAKIVKQFSRKRRMVAAASEIVHGAEAVSYDEVEGWIANGEESILLAGDDRGAQELMDVSTVVRTALADMFSRKAGVTTGITTGFTGLDHALSGWQKNNLIILAGRPGMGKTALGLQCAFAAAVAGWSVLFFSLEMSAAQLGSRLLSSIARVDLDKVLKNLINDSEMTRLMEAGHHQAKYPLRIDDRSGLTVAQIASRARRVKRQHGLDLVVVDYLQLMEPGDNKLSREQQVSTMSRRLKALAKDLNIPVICLAQLSRKPEGRDDKRPIASDLRDSGAIEQDADIILFTYRDSFYKRGGDEDEDENANPYVSEVDVCEVIIAKHRQGSPGTVKLKFIGAQVRFEDMR